MIGEGRAELPLMSSGEVMLSDCTGKKAEMSMSCKGFLDSKKIDPSVLIVKNLGVQATTASSLSGAEKAGFQP